MTSYWWESQAVSVIQTTTNIANILRIVRYIPHRDGKAYVNALSKQPQTVLESLSAHCDVSKKCHHALCISTSIIKSIKRLELEERNSRNSGKNRALSAKQILKNKELTDDVVEQVMQRLDNIVFLDIIEAALGCDISEPLKDFLKLIKCVRHKFVASGSTIMKKGFAGQILQLYGDLRLLYGPIKQIFQNTAGIKLEYPITFTGLLARMNILECRLNRLTENPYVSLDESFQLLQQFEAKNSMFALEKTRQNKELFQEISLHGVRSKNRVFRSILDDWQKLYDAVQELRLIRPDAGDWIFNLASDFDRMDNVHAMMAVMLAIESTRAPTMGLLDKFCSFQAALYGSDFARLIRSRNKAIPYLGPFEYIPIDNEFAREMLSLAIAQVIRYE